MYLKKFLEKKNIRNFEVPVKIPTLLNYFITLTFNKFQERYSGKVLGFTFI